MQRIRINLHLHVHVQTAVTMSPQRLPYEIDTPQSPPLPLSSDSCQDTPTDYPFPIIRSSHPRSAYRQYRTGAGYYNRLFTPAE